MLAVPAIMYKIEVDGLALKLAEKLADITASVTG